MVTAHLSQIAVAVPPSISQKAMWDDCFGRRYDTVAGARRIWSGAGVETRHAVVDPRVEDISERLACPICDGESVFESRNADSQAIRIEIARQVDTGTVSDDQIINFIEQRFGSRVLLVPRSTGIDALVWALPVAALVCAIVGLGAAFRRWKLAADTVPDDADRQLVANALAEDLEAHVESHES